MACRLAFYPLGLPPLVYQTFAYHVHNPEYPMGDVLGEKVVEVDECPDPGNGLNLVEFDPATGELVITPIRQSAHGVVVSIRAPTRPPGSEALEQKDEPPTSPHLGGEWHDVDAQPLD